MAQPLPGPLQEATGLLGHYGYAAVAVCALVEGVGVPAPAVTVLIVAAASAADGRLSVAVLAIVACAAAIVGDSIGYALGHAVGMPALRRWGRYLHLTEVRLDRASGFLTKRGAVMIPLARFIDGFRQTNGLLAGALNLSWRRRYLPLDALGALLWTGVWTTVGYTSGRHLAAAYNAGRHYSIYLLVAAACAVAGYGTWRLVRTRHRTARKPATPEVGARPPARPVIPDLGTYNGGS